MSFSYSSGLITQSGTDTNYSGMIGLTGVTKNGNQYTLDNTRLLVTGTLDVDRTTDRLRFINYADLSGREYIFEVTGTFDNSTVRTYQNTTIYDSLPSISFEFEKINGGNNGPFDGYIQTTSTSNVTIQGMVNVNDGATTGSQFNLAHNFEGNVTLDNAIFLNSTIGTLKLIFTAQTASTITINNGQFYGHGYRTAANGLTVNGLKTFGHPETINVNTSNFVSDLTLEGMEGFGVNTIFRSAAVSANLKFVRYINPFSSIPAPIPLNKVSLSSAAGSQTIVQNRIIFTAQDASGVVANAKIQAIDTDNGNRPTTNYGPSQAYEIATSSDLTYSEITNINGNATFLVTSAVWYLGTSSTDKNIDNRGVANTYDLNYKLASFLHLPAEQTPNHYASGDKNPVFLLSLDASLETNETTIASYSVIDNANKFYDSAKKFWYDNFNRQNLYVTKSGNLIDAGSYNVTIDATASSVFNVSGNTITIKATSYTGDLITTGLITLANGAIFQGTRTDQNGTVYPPIDVTFTDLQAGSQVVVYLTGTTTEKFRTDNSGTSEQWTEVYTADVTYDVTIQKAGFFPIRFINLTASTLPITTSINQLLDRAYQTSSGLTYSTNTNVDTSAKEFSVSVATTVQNYYSFWIEQWISNTALRNIKFPISTFGGNSFSFDDGYEFTSSSLQYLSKDGFRYFDSTVTARYAAILSQGVSTGLQAEYQQAQGGSISDTQNTGNVDQVIQIYGDVTHGNFDYTNYLKFKVQGNGFRQAEADIVSVFGTLEEQFYVTSLSTLAIPNFINGNPNVTGLSITDNSSSPVSWDAGDGTARNYSLTITDTNNNTGENILRWLNYNLSLDATFEGKDPFYYSEMVIDNGSSYETIRGILYESTSNVLAGVRVIDENGDAHRDFTRFQSDNGTYGVPVEIKSAFISGITSGSRLKIFNITTGLTTFNGFINATTYTEEYQEGNNYSQSDQLETTLTYQIGTSAKIPLISQVIVGATGWSLLVNQKDLPAYSSLGADGSTVTEYNIDSNTGNLEIDANDTDCFSAKRRLVARYYYLITTEEGINRFVNAIILEDSANAIIDRAITNLLVDNTGSCTLNLTDSDFRLYTSDGSSWIKNPPTGGFGIISDSGKVYVKGQEQLENKVDELIDREDADIYVSPTSFVKKKKGTDVVIVTKNYTTDGQGNETLTETT